MSSTLPGAGRMKIPVPVPGSSTSVSASFSGVQGSGPFRYTSAETKSGRALLRLTYRPNLSANGAEGCNDPGSMSRCHLKLSSLTAAFPTTVAIRLPPSSPSPASSLPFPNKALIAPGTPSGSSASAGMNRTTYSGYSAPSRASTVCTLDDRATAARAVALRPQELGGSRSKTDPDPGSKALPDELESRGDPSGSAPTPSFVSLTHFPGGGPVAVKCGQPGSVNASSSAARRGSPTTPSSTTTALESVRDDGSSFSFSSSSSPFASSPFASFPSEGSSASARLDETFARVEAFAPPEKVRRVAAAPPSFPSEPPRVPSAPAAVPVPYPFGELVENDREPAPHVPAPSFSPPSSSPVVQSASPRFASASARSISSRSARASASAASRFLRSAFAMNGNANRPPSSSEAFSPS
mmetsp:Transcript_1025/g.3972  ORF Transcript_1025/g.3972 Transcript_1025/m.3972 type:complete len:411 (-) Transcript_1025:1929-3161(-)